MCIVLDKLEKLTSSLPHISDLSEFKVVNNGITTYELDNGVAISENIYSTPDIGIAKTFIPKGTNFNTHKHAISGEWVIVLEGLLDATINSKSILLSKYDSIKIDAATPHSAIAVEDTTIIAITVPKDEGYPEH
jgi:quercetin dioxygenase-like cupin family protein